MKIINPFIRRREQITAGPGIPSSTAEQPQVQGANYGENGVTIYSPGAALTVAAWHRAVELRAKTMSQLIMEYQRYNAVMDHYVQDNGRQGLQPGSRLNYLLQVRPNPLMTASVLMQQAEIAIIMRGNAYIYIERDSYDWPMALWLCNGGGYNPMNDTYSISYNAQFGVRAYDAVPSRDIIHIPNTFRMDGGYLGIPTLVYAQKVLSLSATSDREAMKTAANGGKLKIIVQEKENTTFGFGGRAAKSQMRKVTDELNADIYKSDVVLTSNAANITPISMNAQQMELLQSRVFNVAEVSRMTGVPKALLMDDSQSSYKTPEAATHEFLLRTIQPKIREWENELDCKLLLPVDFGRYRIHLSERDLLRLDRKAQADIDKIHLETGVKSVNELRSGYDLPRIKDGDTHYVSTNLAEVGSAKLTGEKGGEQ